MTKFIRKTRWVLSPEERARRRAAHERAKADLLASLSPEDEAGMEQWLGPTWRDYALADLEGALRRVRYAQEHPPGPRPTKEQLEEDRRALFGA